MRGISWLAANPLASQEGPKLILIEYQNSGYLLGQGPLYLNKLLALKLCWSRILFYSLLLYIHGDSFAIGSKIFKDRIISRNIWPPRSPDLTPADFFLWGLLKSKLYKNTPHTIEQLKEAIRHSIPEFGQTHSSVLGCEMRPFSASIMSRSCFASFPVCVYKFSSHYLNNIMFYRQ
jgi:hypothetical protein